MNNLYPLKFNPVFKEKIWGGQRIKTLPGMDFSPLPNCGEAWVLSGIPGTQTTVANGFLEGNELNELVEVYMDDLLGESVFARFSTEFPLLVKFIDSNEYLSIQVHPDDALAAKRGLENGKSEMWYILHAEKNAELITGFNRKMDQKTYLEFLETKRIREILNTEKPAEGNVFDIPAGRIHAIGPGILLAEIQQSSDTTYRIYDWDRVDDKGAPRELHTELALDAIDFTFHDSYKTGYLKKKNHTVTLVDSPRFLTNILDFNKPVIKDYSFLDSFVILLCVDGSAGLKFEGGTEELKKGGLILVPAVMDEISLFPASDCRILEVCIP
jgi:mannose-6-phosphate isomerase